MFYLDLLSNTLDLSYALLHLIKKKKKTQKNKEECVLNSPSLYMSKLRHKGINELTNMWKRCFMVNVLTDTVKFAETALSLDHWGKKLLVNSIF